MSLWIQITSGKGPNECAWVVGQLSKRLQHEASRTGFVLEVVGGEPGEEPGTFHSLLLELADAFRLVAEVPERPLVEAADVVPAVAGEVGDRVVRADELERAGDDEGLHLPTLGDDAGDDGV